MRVVNIHEAKTHLSRLLERVASGEDIVIAKAGHPVVRLVPFEPVEPKIAPPGAPDFKDRRPICDGLDRFKPGTLTWFWFTVAHHPRKAYPSSAANPCFRSAIRSSTSSSPI